MRMDGLNFQPLSFKQGGNRTPTTGHETGKQSAVEQRESVDLGCTPAPALDQTGQKGFADETRVEERGGTFQFPNQVEAPRRDGDLNWVLGGAKPQSEEARPTLDPPLFEGQAGILLGNLPTTPPNYEDFGGAFLRHS